MTEMPLGDESGEVGGAPWEPMPSWMHLLGSGLQPGQQVGVDDVGVRGGPWRHQFSMIASDDSTPGRASAGLKKMKFTYIERFDVTGSPS